jgi:hypothetical protein
MKVGDLVRYKPWPHVELHASGITGIITREPYEVEDCDLMWVDVVWSKERPQCPAGEPMWEFEDELEKINGQERTF